MTQTVTAEHIESGDAATNMEKRLTTPVCAQGAARQAERLTWALVTGQTCPPAPSIPPNNWMSVDILVWDYKKHLEEFGHKAALI